MNYAQLDNDNLVVAVHDTFDSITDPTYIQIDSFDVSLLGKIYDPDTKTFKENPNPPEPVEEPEQESEDDEYTTIPELSKAVTANSTGIDDLGSVVSDLSTALNDLASAFAELQEAKNG